MERAYLASATGFGLAIFLAIASVEINGFSPDIAAVVMTVAVVAAAAVAVILLVVMWREFRGPGRPDDAVVGDAGTANAVDSAAPRAGHPWAPVGREVVIAAPHATAWSNTDIDLLGAVRPAGTPTRGQSRSRLVRLVRRSESDSPRQWWQAVEASDLDGVIPDMDATSHDDHAPVESPGLSTDPAIDPATILPGRSSRPSAPAPRARQ